jgi:hypothetical protein
VPAGKKWFQAWLQWCSSTEPVHTRLQALRLAAKPIETLASGKQAEKNNKKYNQAKGDSKEVGDVENIL